MGGPGILACGTEVRLCARWLWDGLVVRDAASSLSSGRLALEPPRRVISMSSVVARWHSCTNEHSGEQLSLGVHAWPVLSGGPGIPWTQSPNQVLSLRSLGWTRAAGLQASEHLQDVAEADSRPLGGVCASARALGGLYACARALGGVCPRVHAHA